MKFLSLFVLVFVVAVTAFAQVASPAPVPIPSVGDVLLNFLALVKSWGTLGFFAGIAAALKLLIDATKAFGLWDKIPTGLQTSFVLLVGVLTVGLTVLASGGTLVAALAAALGSSGAAMLLHELVDDLLTWLHKKLDPPKDVAK